MYRNVCCSFSGRQLSVPRRSTDLGRRRKMGSSQACRVEGADVGWLEASLVRQLFDMRSLSEQRQGFLYTGSNYVGGVLVRFKES
jgi:hypothetical protein